MADENPDLGAEDNAAPEEDLELEEQPDGEVESQVDEDHEDPEAGEGAETGGRPQDALDPEPPARQPNRTQARIQELARRTTEANDRAARAEERAAAAERAAARRENEQSESAERERVSLMTAEERVDHYRARDRQEYDRKLNGIQFTMLDSSDKAEFRALCAGKKHFADVADEVEKRLAAARAHGQNTDRATIAKYIIGERAVARAERAGGQQRRRGAENLTRERTTPARSRSDQPAPRRQDTRGESPEARRKRLEGVTF